MVAAIFRGIIFGQAFGFVRPLTDRFILSLAGNADLCRSVSHSLLETLVLKMHHSFNHGIFCRGLVDSLVYIVQAAPPLLSVSESLPAVASVSNCCSQCKDDGIFLSHLLCRSCKFEKQLSMPSVAVPNHWDFTAIASPLDHRCIN